MPKISVLVVDDAVVVRRMLTSILEEDPTLKVAGFASNGRTALARIAQCSPDVVILDVEMPEMDGLETLREIRRRDPRLPVIMFSRVTKRGAAATLDALSLGASDYVAKPSGAAGASGAAAAIRESLIPKIKIFGARQAGLTHEPAFHPDSQSELKRRWMPRTGVRSSVRVVAIGVSTGGPSALDELLPEFPADFPVPIVIVQHMPAIFTRLLAERLSQRCQIRIQEGHAGAELQPGYAWIAPGNHHLALSQSGTAVTLQINQDPPENSCRPAVDVLFRSVAQIYGSHSLGIVMTGMGQDGLRGSEHIREAGGQILAQDEASSVVWGMPGYVARAGLADKVVPLSRLGREVVERVMKSGIGASADAVPGKDAVSDGSLRQGL